MPASCLPPLVRRACRAAIFRFAPAAAAAFAMALPGACASIESSTMQDVLDSWKGVPIDDAKTQWGPPQTVQAVPGGTAYVWQDTLPQPTKPQARKHTTPAWKRRTRPVAANAGSWPGPTTLSYGENGVATPAASRRWSALAPDSSTAPANKRRALAPVPH